MKRLVPNAVTLLRFLLLPVFAALFVEGRRTAAVAVLGGIAFSDWLDGFLARRWETASRFGALLDPVADKLVQVTALTLLVLEESIPAWFFALVVARELLLLYGVVRIRQRRGRVEVRARLAGKLSTLLVYAVVFAALLGAPRGMVLAAVIGAAPFVVSSAIFYTIEGKRQYSA